MKSDIYVSFFGAPVSILNNTKKEQQSRNHPKKNWNSLKLISITHFGKLTYYIISLKYKTVKRMINIFFIGHDDEGTFAQMLFLVYYIYR